MGLVLKGHTVQNRNQKGNQGWMEGLVCAGFAWGQNVRLPKGSGSQSQHWVPLSRFMMPGSGSLCPWAKSHLLVAFELSMSAERILHFEMFGGGGGEIKKKNTP